jgi:hypothetical protein
VHGSALALCAFDYQGGYGMFCPPEQCCQPFQYVPDKAPPPRTGGGDCTPVLDAVYLPPWIVGVLLRICISDRL